MPNRNKGKVPNSVTDQIIRVVRHHMPFEHYRMFYFGSRVRGSAKARSDFDVGVEASDKIPLEVLSRIKEELEEIPVLQKIDLVDFAAVPDDFSTYAKRAFEIIYEQ